MREIWDSPLYPLEDRLEMCAGAVAFEREVAANMRRQLDEAREITRELVAGMEEVIAISDRKHDAWDRAKAALVKATGTL